ncbi:MAG TPA: TonB-dependent receptor [Rhodocyclaceae bacterium]|nr:TonB-dependent receptor [Rhodocyclaceae bacterium]
MRPWLLAAWAGLCAFATHAASPDSTRSDTALPEVKVSAQGQGTFDADNAASSGFVSGDRWETRPLLRPGEVMEAVPGMIASQHSGDGKANQYYLRGFNLDHGTDFAATLMGMPLNMPTHAHGQGYLDLNFLIPELVETVEYHKGPYWAEEGDFASAGAARIDYRQQLERAYGQVTAGQNNYRRGLLAGSQAYGDGRLLAGLEAMGNDGPWQTPEGLRKLNAVLRYGWGIEGDGGSVALLAYDSRWTATDQVPQRAIDAGLLNRYGSLDPTDGGDAQRFSLSGEWAGSLSDGLWKANAYAISSRLNLWSNFTYATDPLASGHGDQFQQTDQRRIYGGGASRSWRLDGSRPVEFTLGGQVRLDRIGKLGLNLTDARRIWATVREDAVAQDYGAIYAKALVQWSERLRSEFGLRGDYQHYRVASDRAANSGTASGHLWSPKFSLAYAPMKGTEFFFNTGLGFHSNDGRGTTTRINPDPRDAAGFLGPVAPVTPLVRTRGTEFGVRLTPNRQTKFGAALWRLDQASELLFTGDAGTTEPSRPSRRQGLELTADWELASGLKADADLALSRARYTQDDPAGNHIPGAAERVASLGIDYIPGTPWTVGAALRHFGPRALVENNSVRSSSSTLVNLRGSYRASADLLWSVDVLNLFDRRVSDIDYYYASRLPGEAAAVNDVHTHPAEPRTIRVTLRWFL